MSVVERDERRWTIHWTDARANSSLAKVTGPNVDVGEAVEVAPADQLTGAVDAVRQQAGRVRYETDTPPGRLAWETLHQSVRDGWIRDALGERP